MSARSNILAAGLALAAVLGAPSVASAADDYVGTTTEVKGNSFTRPPEVQGVTVAREPGEAGLPITGGDIAGLTVVGLGAVGVGTVLVRRGRTRAVAA
jgi:hypothetical protein